MKKRILVIGGVYLENEIQINGIPMAGQTARAGEYSESIGGRGAEAALAAGKLAGNAILLGRVGSDPNGRRMREFISKNGVDIRFLSEIRGEKTAVCTRLCEQSSAREILFPGAGRALSMKDAERAFSCSPEAVYLNLDVPYEVVIASARFAKAKKIPAFLSLSPVRRDFPFDLLEGIDTLFLSEEEVFQYIGVRAASPEGCMKATVEMQHRTGARCVIIKRGEKGVYISQGKYYKIIPAYAIQPEDAAFADAAFDVAYITHYLQHGEYEAACGYANIVGTLTASREGKLASVPDAAEVDRFARVNCPDLLRGEEDDGGDWL